MIKPDQRKRLQQIARLRLAAETIDWLRAERPELTRRLPTGITQDLRALAEAYEANPVKHFFNCKECREGRCRIHTTAPLRLHDEERKPRPRVAMSKRRPPLKLSGKMREIPIAQREFDGEAEHEEGLTYGHDVPDGSD